MSAAANTASIIATTISSPTTSSLLFKDSSLVIPLDLITTIQNIPQADRKNVIQREMGSGETSENAKEISGFIENAGVTQNVVSINPTFKLVFITVVLITVLSGIGDIYLASTWAAPTGNQQSIFEALGFAWKAGVGAIFGLLGGKVS